jgi:hypothetical protein
MLRIILSICENTNSKICKKTSFNNLCEIFKNDQIYVLGDNLSNDFENFVKSKNINFIENKVRGRSTYFIDKLDFCLNNFTTNDSLYLIEDDYLHKIGSDKLIEEGLQHSDYVTLYDHPDKYSYNGWTNPEVTDIGERTIVFLTKSSHWKFTNSTTGTFACKYDTLKSDYNVWIDRFKQNPTSCWDYESFLLLRSKNRKIASCIPGRSTHLHSDSAKTPFF